MGNLKSPTTVGWRSASAWKLLGLGRQGVADCGRACVFFNDDSALALAIDPDGSND